MICLVLAYFGHEYRSIKREVNGLRQLGIQDIGVVTCRRSNEPRWWITSDPFEGIVDYANLTVGDNTPESPSILKVLLGDRAGSRIVEPNLFLANTNASDAIRIAANSFRQLEVISLPWDTADADLKFLEALSDLQILSLEGCGKVKGEGLEHLAKLPNLTILDLRLAKIQESKYEHLASLNNLRVLLLANSSFQTNSLEHVHRLSELRWLELPHQAVITGQYQLNRLSNLQKLSASCTDEGLICIAQIESLTELDISGSGLLTKAGLSCLANTHIHTLLLKHCYLHDDLVASLRHMSKLEHLDLSANYDVTDATVNRLTAITNLNTLRLGHTGVSDDAIENLIQMRNLKFVDLSNTLVTQDGVDRLAARRPQLKVVCDDLARVDQAPTVEQ